jgi:hypothetical protein
LIENKKKKYTKFLKKFLAYFPNIMYTNNCCGMIALKREVAAGHCRFSVERMSRGHANGQRT